MASLLAVDVGLRTGMALFRADGRLEWYRSRKLSKTALLKRIAFSMLKEIPDLEWIVLEGGGPLAAVWEKIAAKRGIEVLRVCAEEWRDQLLNPWQARTGTEAKKSALIMARKVIEWSGGPKPTSLRHDAAEAILIGFWGVMRVGWIVDPPPDLISG